MRIGVIFALAAIFLPYNAFASDKTSNSSSIPVAISPDPRMELLSIIQLLSSHHTLYQTDSEELDYKDERKAHFYQYKQHEAVQKYKELSSKGFDFGRPSNAMKLLTPSLNVNSNVYFSDELLTPDYTPVELLDFLNAVVKFSVDSDFQEFYRNNVRIYNINAQNSLS